jgi:hypothetical protein
LHEQFEEEFYGENNVNEELVPRVSTVRRILKRSGQSRKKLTWVNVKRKLDEELEFLQRISHVAANRIVDIDGMVQCPTDFESKYGWAPRGQRAFRTQICIRDRTFAVHAACCEKGFLLWDVFEGMVRGENVKQFLEKLPGVLQQASAENYFGANTPFGLLDNASNRRTIPVRQTLGEVFNEKYQYCAPYSPHLKPVERGFSLVKAYIQQFDDHVMDLVDLINEAFHNYSTKPGYSGHVMYNFFNVYRVNHEMIYYS